jgi:predicted methyltransferase
MIAHFIEAGRGLAQDLIRVRDESVDLIYHDPPFNSNASYNILSKASDRRTFPGADRSVRRHCEARDA